MPSTEVEANIEAFAAGLKALPKPYDPVTNDIDYQNPRLKKQVEGPCGDLLKQGLECYINSSAQIKGIDCADTFNSLIECCKSNKGSCHPRLELEEEQ